MRVVNIVAVAKVKEHFDLSLLSSKFPEAEFPRRKAPWLKMRIRPENYYTAFYPSGKFLVTGVNDFDAIDVFIERVLGILQKAGIVVNLEAVKIHNIVLVDYIELNTTLENIVTSTNDPGFFYEPEQFCGLLYKDKTGISYMLYSTGSLIVTGFTDLTAATKNIIQFKKLLAT